MIRGKPAEDVLGSVVRCVEKERPIPASGGKGGNDTVYHAMPVLLLQAPQRLTHHSSIRRCLIMRKGVHLSLTAERTTPHTRHTCPVADLRPQWIRSDGGALQLKSLHRQNGTSRRVDSTGAQD